MGTPAIATSVGGPAELIEDGVNGRLVEPQEPERWAATIEELLADASLRQTMGERAQQTAAAFGREAHVERVLRAYREVLGAPTRA